jgi:predicted ATPase
VTVTNAFVAWQEQIVLDTLSSIRHIGALRPIPSTWSEEFDIDHELGLRDRASSEGDEYDFLPSRQASKWLEILTDKRFSLRYEEVKLEGLHSFGLAKYVLDHANGGAGVRLSEVGTGISQILPVIEAVFHPFTDIQTVLIEQPELHLHPKAQGHVADLLIEAVKMQKQVIAETHSENLLLRIQKRVQQGVITPEQVSILYIDTSEGIPEEDQVRRIRMDYSGNFIDEWPSSFIDIRINEYENNDGSSE